MSRKMARLAVAAVVALSLTLLAVSQSKNRQSKGPIMGDPGEKVSGNLQQATFGSGCFWCTEAIFEQLDGVSTAVSGYTGGRIENPTYEAICTGQTGHAEAVQITFDPRKISYAELLEVFWRTHDPTTLNRQGGDVGTQYRSAVFFHNEQQRELAEGYKQKLDAASAFDSPIVTEITAAETFYPAEDYHQEYFEQNPSQSYCSLVIRPKVDKFKKVFAEKLKGASDSLEKVTKSNEQWKAQLTDEQYRVTREKGTEQAFTGKYWNEKRSGVYQCVGCGLPLFESTTKFDAGCGWPSFFAPAEEEHVTEAQDGSLGTQRTEILCSRCDAHLGHVFSDGPNPTGLRYCVNSASLQFDESEKPVDASEAEDDSP